MTSHDELIENLGLVRAERDKAEGEVDRLQGKLDNAEKDHDIARRGWDRAREELRGVHKELDKTKAERDAQAESLRKVRAQRDKAEGERGRLKMTLEYVTRGRDEAEKERDVLQERIDQADAVLKGWGSSVSRPAEVGLSDSDNHPGMSYRVLINGTDVTEYGTEANLHFADGEPYGEVSLEFQARIEQREGYVAFVLNTEGDND
jgi:seryl-tRNA synthetase